MVLKYINEQIFLLIVSMCIDESWVNVSHLSEVFLIEY